MTDKLGFELGQVDEDNDGEMDVDWIVIYQAVHHLFCSRSVWNLKKPFGVDILGYTPCIEPEKGTGRMVW